MATDLAARKISLLNPTVRHGLVATPCAPHKQRDGESILRRSTSQLINAQVSLDNPRRTARRLTWTDARDIAGLLEHVHHFDVRDGFAQCGGIAPESARFAPDYSPVRLDDAVPARNFSSKTPDFAVPHFDVEQGVPVFTLDDASRAAARRIAAQLLRHEAVHGDTSTLDSRTRIGKMLKRRVTPRVAASVEGLSAAARVGQAEPEPTSLTSPSTDLALKGRGNEGIQQTFPIDRHITTAGDALLVYLVTAQLRLQRQLQVCEQTKVAKVREIEKLLQRGDKLVSNVPSRRVASALKALHRDALALIDAKALIGAADASVLFLETALGGVPGLSSSVGNQSQHAVDDVHEAVETVPAHCDVRGAGERRLSHVRRTVSQSPGRSGKGKDEAAQEHLREDMADAFFEILQLGGLLPRGAR